MASITNAELAELIAGLSQQLAALNERIERLEGPRASHAPAPPAQAAPPEISPDELIAISAAVAAFLGVRAHIRQIRLIGSRAWAQEGRVSIQASHRLYS
jgi:methylmalonyl-CoA carboxyltransferase 12S subunit